MPMNLNPLYHSFTESLFGNTRKSGGGIANSVKLEYWRKLMGRRRRKESDFPHSKCRLKIPKQIATELIHIDRWDPTQSFRRGRCRTYWSRTPWSGFSSAAKAASAKPPAAPSSQFCSPASVNLCSSSPLILPTI